MMNHRFFGSCLWAKPQKNQLGSIKTNNYRAKSQLCSLNIIGFQHRLTEKTGSHLLFLVLRTKHVNNNVTTGNHDNHVVEN
jgi:hypothetical protein